jgi:hypothetical protein
MMEQTERGQMLKATFAILAAFLLLCGAIALNPALAGPRAPVAVFDGVSAEDLASENIVLMDSHPSASPSVPLDRPEQTVLAEPGIVIQGTQLVRIQLTNQGTPISPPLVAWALRIDTSHLPEDDGSRPCCFWIGGGTVFAIVFFDANNGADVATFVRFPPRLHDFRRHSGALGVALTPSREAPLFGHVC